MSAFVPQQPNVPPTGPYYNSGSQRQYGVTADDIRKVKKEAAEEDYSQFLTSDTQYMDYKKTDQEIVYFENIQKSNPDYMRIKLPKNTYPIRTDSAYFQFQFDAIITIPKTTPKPDPPPEGKQYAEEDPLDLTEITPKSFKFWKAIDSYEITVGSNACVITNSEQSYHYQNRIMSVITKPVSKSNLNQEYATADNLFDLLFLDIVEPGKGVDSILSKLLWKYLKIDAAQVKQKSESFQLRIPLQFQIPLTMLHPLYNFNSIIPPGMDTSFTFKFRPFSDIAKGFFSISEKAATGGFKIRIRTVASRCFLYVEQPRRYPQILRSLKTKAYYNDILMEKFQRIDFTVGEDVTYVDKLVLIPPGSGVPVRIDWILYATDATSYPKDETDAKFYFMNSTDSYLDQVKFLVHFPFPYEKTIQINTEVSRQGDAEIHTIYPPSSAEAYYHSEDNFVYATYGNQHVQHGVFPQVAKMDGLAEYAAHAHVMDNTDPAQLAMITKIEEVKTLAYPNSVLILPSDQLNQNPYPRILGDVYMSLRFRETGHPTKFVLHLNYYYWYRIHQENGKCSFYPIDDLGVKLDESDRP